VDTGAEAQEKRLGDLGSASVVKRRAEGTGARFEHSLRARGLRVRSRAAAVTEDDAVEGAAECSGRSYLLVLCSSHGIPCS
jgi:hypothetical protein